MSKAKRKERRTKRKSKRVTRRNTRKANRKLYGGRAKFTPLLPFKKLMKNALKKEGVSTGNKINEIAVKFYEKIVLKKSRFEIPWENLGGDEGENEMANDYAANAGTGSKIAVGAATVAGTAAAGPAGGAVISAIVKAILDFLKRLKKKKENGEELKGAEKEILDAAEEVANTTKEVAGDEAKYQIGNIISSYWWVLILAVAFLMFRKKIM